MHIKQCYINAYWLLLLIVVLVIEVCNIGLDAKLHNCSACDWQRCQPIVEKGGGEDFSNLRKWERQSNFHKKKKLPVIREPSRLASIARASQLTVCHLYLLPAHNFLFPLSIFLFELSDSVGSLGMVSSVSQSGDAWARAVNSREESVNVSPSITVCVYRTLIHNVGCDASGKTF